LIKKCLRLFLTPLHLKKSPLKILGYAELEKDIISGQYRWVTYDKESLDRFSYEPGEPINISPNVAGKYSYIQFCKKDI